MDTHNDFTGYGLYYKGDKQLFALNTVFLVFAVVVVAYRFWAQRGKSAWYLPENVFCSLALLSFAAQCGIVYVIVLQAHLGNAYRTPAEESLYARMTTALQFPYGLAMGFIRTSIVLFELHMFGVVHWFKRVGYLLLALVASWTIMVIVLALTICHPIKFNWNKSIHGHCGNVKASYEGIAGTGIVLDVLIFLAPMPIIWKLQTSISHKLLISVLFIIGLFDIIMGALRLLGLTDSLILATAFGIVEPAIAIFIASAPHYRSLYTKLARYIDSTGNTISLLYHFVHGSKSESREASSEKMEPGNINYGNSHQQGSVSTGNPSSLRSAHSAAEVV